MDFYIKIGENFLHYQILKKLGVGGMGTVYKAFDRKLERLVALKVVSSLSISPQESQRFFREATAHAQFDHPNIIKLFEVGKTPTNYLTMEYIEGPTFSSLIQSSFLTDKKTNPIEIAQLIKQVAIALHEIHKQKIVHRDIKPDNIMIDNNQQPKLMDFGVAKVSYLKRLSATGDIVGTLWYMSPEQVDGKKVDARSDIYSLGATLYEALTNKHPFFGESHLDIMTKILEQPPPSLTSLNPNIPRDLEIICLKCLSKKPKERYSTAKNLAIELDNFIHGRSLAFSGTPLTNVNKFVRRSFFYGFIPLFIVVLDIGIASLLTPGKIIQDAKEYKKEFSKDLQPQELYLKMGIHHFAKKDLAKALLHYNKAIAANPKYLEAYFHRGNLYKSKNNFKSALADFNKALTHDSPYVQAYFARGQVYYYLKSYHKAIADFSLAIKSNIKKLDSYHLRAHTYCYLKRYQEATRDFNQALKIAPKNVWTPFYQAILQHHRKNYKAVEQKYNRFIALNPKEAQGYFHRGRLYFSLKRFKAAKEDFNRAIKLDPNNPYNYYFQAHLSIINIKPNYPYSYSQIHKPILQNYQGVKSSYKKFLAFNIDKKYDWYWGKVYYWRGYSHYLLGNFKEAQSECKKAIDNRSLYLAEIYNLWGLIMRGTGNYKKALEYYSKVISLDPKYAKVYSDRGELYQFILKDYKKAEYDYNKAIDLDFRFTKAYSQRALLYLTLQRYYQEIIKDCIMALKIQPDNKVLYYQQGYANLRLKRYKKAEDCYKRALSIDPNYVLCLVSYAHVLHTTKRLKEALKKYNQCIKIDPQSPAYYGRGMVYADLHLYDKAKDDLDRAVIATPKNFDNYLKRGNIYVSLKRYQEAIEDYSKAISLNPKLAKLYFKRGSLYLTLKQNDKALKDFQTARKLDK